MSENGNGITKLLGANRNGAQHSAITHPKPSNATSASGHAESMHGFGCACPFMASDRCPGTHMILAPTCHYMATLKHRLIVTRSEWCGAIRTVFKSDQIVEIPFWLRVICRRFECHWRGESVSNRHAKPRSTINDQRWDAIGDTRRIFHRPDRRDRC